MCTQKKHDEPVHIVNVAIRYDTHEEDDTYAAAFEDFCAEKVRISTLGRSR